MKITKKIAVLILILFMFFVVLGIYKFNYLSSKPGYDVDGNKIEHQRTTLVIWRDANNKLVFNDTYFENITEKEKAAIGYLITFIGTECEWEGEYNDKKDNLKCLALSKLNLGYQCSETHLGFLRKWFKNDTKSLINLKNCPTIPNTATIQDALDSLLVVASHENELILKYSITSYNFREEEGSKEFKKEMKFKVFENSINLID